MHDTGLVSAIAHLTSLGVLYRSRHIGRHGADFRVGHQATRTENLTQLTDDAHGVRAGHHHIEIEFAGFDLFSQIFHTDQISARSQRCFLILAGGEHRHPHRLADAIRHDRRATHLLIGLGSVDAEIHCDIHGFLELGAGKFLHQRQGLLNRILLARLNLASPGLYTLGNGCHVRSPPHRRPCCVQYRRRYAWQRPDRQRSDPAA